MIPTVISTSEFSKLFRTELITQSGVSAQFVRNAHTTFGAELDKLVNSIYVSIVKTDCLVLFSIEEGSSEKFVTEYDDDNDKIYSYVSLTCHVSMYGDNSKDIAIKTASRFKTQVCHDRLYSNGAHVSNVSDVTETHDFKNDVIWSRNDFIISFACRMQIDPIETPYKPNIISELIIEEA